MNTIDIKRIDEILELAPKLFKIASQIVVGVGALLVFFYCGRIRYFPIGIGLGDSIFFVWASIAFGIIYSIWVYVLYSIGTLLIFLVTKLASCLRFAVYPLSTNVSNLVKKVKDGIPNITKEEIPLIIAGIIVGSIITPLIFFDDIFNGFKFIGASFLTGFGFLVIKKIKFDKNHYKYIFVVTVYLLPLVTSGLSGKLINQAMKVVGIRNDNAYIKVSKDYGEFMSSFQEDGQEKINKEFVECTIVFKGIGENTVIEIDRKGKKTNFIVPNNQIYISYTN